MDSVNKRRSTRKFTDEPISREQIKELLKAGMCAPSAHNQQPYRFIVIENQDKKEAIAAFHPYGKAMTEAAFGVLVYFDETVLKSPAFVQQDCAAAVENMLIKATDMGIGGCWIGVYPNEKIVTMLQELFDMKNQDKPFALVSFGMPESIKEANDRYEESWVRYE